jgi:secreted trypsin-like serine protease
VRIAALLGVVLTAGLLGAAPAGAVANGTLATAGQFPWAVQLRMHAIPLPGGGTYDSACSGVLISPTWIMTAGHCFHDVNKVRVSGSPRYATTARLGTVNTTDPAAGITKTVNWVQQSASSDMAIARLDSPVVGITPVRLNKNVPRLGQLFVLTGWGATTATGQPSAVLRWGQFKVTGVKPSTLLLSGYRPSPATSACPYDSGAPFLGISANGTATLVSVESTGPACPHRLSETTTRVDVYVAWTKKYVADLPA